MDTVLGIRHWIHGNGGTVLGAPYWGTVFGTRYWGNGSGGTVLEAQY